MDSIKKPNGYWTKDRCIVEAIKYHSRSEFKKSSRSAFASAQRHNWLDEICSHMIIKKKENGFWTKELCAIEAVKYQSRSNFQHGSNSAYGRAHKEGWLDEICSHMDVHKRMKDHYTKEACIKESIKYSDRSEFRRGCRAAYNAARMNGWLDDVCSHMLVDAGWDKTSCAFEALKHESKKAFRIGSLAAYNFAYKNGWLDEICAHMETLRKPKGYWTKERCIEEALKYQTLKEFEKMNWAAVRSVRKHGWQSEVFSKMTMKQKPSGYWTNENCLAEALKYQNRHEFRKKCESAYSKARKNGWLDEICGHMSMVVNPSGYWSEERCTSEALKYETRNDFRKGSESAYSAARKNGWLDRIVSHMVEVIKPSGHWTKDNCLAEALKYESRTDFSVGSNGAYKIASKYGWLEEICSHMVPVGNEYLRGLYLIINKKLMKAYIGLTSNFERRKQEHLKGSRTNSSDIINAQDTEFIPLTDYMDVGKAAELELQFVNEYEKQGYLLLNDRSRIGGLGGSRLKWIEELCQQEALKYQTRYEFQKGSRQAHAAAQRQGILNKICNHMTTPKRKVYWTKELVAQEALKYQSRATFSKGSGGAYNSARKNGWLDELCHHMLDKK